MCIVVAKGALPNESGTHDAAAARPVGRSFGRSEGLVCVFAKTIYNTRKVNVVLRCVASRRFSSHHLKYASGAVTPAAATAVQVAVAYGGRLLRFSFGQRKYINVENSLLFVCIYCTFCVRFYFLSTRRFVVLFKMRLLHTILY